MVIGILMSFDGYGSAPSWRFVGFENYLRAKCIPAKSIFALYLLVVMSSPEQEMTNSLLNDEQRVPSQWLVTDSESTLFEGIVVWDSPLLVT